QAPGALATVKPTDDTVPLAHSTPEMRIAGQSALTSTRSPGIEFVALRPRLLLLTPQSRPGLSLHPHTIRHFHGASSVVARASRPCESCNQHTGETPVLLPDLLADLRLLGEIGPI